MTAINFGTDLAWPWFSLVGAATTFGIGCLASWFSAEWTRDAG
jgi:hypothetical protein